MSLADDIIHQREDRVAQRLTAGAEVNALDEYGFTPLIEAAVVNHPGIAALLLEHGAAVDEPDTTGNTALHWAAENNNLDLCTQLLDGGANPNAYTTYGQPVLLKPLLRRQTDLKKLLCQRGAHLAFAQDYLNAKLLAHRFELAGRIDIVEPAGKFIEISLEGFILEFTVGLIQDSLARFKNHFVARHLRVHFRAMQRVIDALAAAAELLRYQQYLVDRGLYRQRIDKLLDRDLLIIPIGYEGHAITLVKLGDRLARCDRGEYSRLGGYSVVIYRIGNPYALDSALIKRLLYEKLSAEMVNEGLVRHLGLVPLTQLPLTSQVAGNCSWANVEAAIPTALFLLAWEAVGRTGVAELIGLKEQGLSLYHVWREWDKERALRQCIEGFYEAGVARKAAIAALLAAVLCQGLRCSDVGDVRRAERILPVLETPRYAYILEGYLKVFTRESKTELGKNLVRLLGLCRK